jgi:hypothetical protein
VGIAVQEGLDFLGCKTDHIGLYGDDRQGRLDPRARPALFA